MKISVQDCLNLINVVVEPLFSDLALHLRQSSLIAFYIARNLKLSDAQIKDVFISASLHDLGLLLKSAQNYRLDAEDILGGYYLNGLEVQNEIAMFNRISNSLYVQESNCTLVNDIVYFSDAFELYLNKQDEDFISYSETLVEDFFSRHSDFRHEIVDAMNRLAKDDVFWLRLESSNMHKVLQRISPLRDSYVTLEDLKDICLILARIVDIHSSFTVTHSTSVSHVAAKIASLMSYPQEQQQKIGIAGYLHDIGKVYIPSEILNKEGQLTRKERALMKKHSYKTLEMLSYIKSLQEIIPWAANHHERLDGSGYPFGLNANELDETSRIIAIADMFTALTEDRPYRKGMELSQVVDILDSEVAQGKLDGLIVDIVKRNIYALFDCVGKIILK
ncbi:TPA: HD domain-containing protein [Enterobacter soli]|uniref:HD-GYP domain-containing protein n=1 Tax=Enterobacter sp. CP102 TaxID=2976431 RepID=UPI002201ECB4|nr:HD domain-containing phosphohydrolase [Enterobacter sp. CP102]UWM64719.1 HD domain-containing protein [Enterobacter sp. CP102]HDX4052093.1 HD domain-containing protein [Enterobacter soli]